MTDEPFAVKEKAMKETLRQVLTQFDGKEEIEVLEILANVVGNTIGQLHGDRGMALAFMMKTALEIIQLHMDDEPDEDTPVH
jgi:hypothetical protein